MNSRLLGALALAAALLGISIPVTRAAEPLLLVVVDPLSKELACACVKGFGQRDYRKLAAKLEATLKQRVVIEFAEDLGETLTRAGTGRELLLIGDRSVIAHGTAKAGVKCQPVAALTDVNGETTLGATFLARAGDPAKSLKDLAGRRFIFGLAEADAKSAAALEALRTAGVEPLAKVERRAAFTDAGLDTLDSPASPPPVAVVPGYGLRLLEGCGSVKLGELRVLGTSAPAPFITAFLADTLPAAKREKVLQALLGLKADAKLLQALESRDGFQPLAAPKPGASADWPDWRGANRDGRVAQLPERLAEKPKLIWKQPALPNGLAGLSVSGGRVIVADRDFADAADVYRCHHADTGEVLWEAIFPTHGKLDYGQAPRATPVLHAGRAYLLGAHGELRCVRLADGSVVWKRHLAKDFKAALPTWGFSAPPLLADGLLIINPGAKDAALVALDPVTGATRWATPGNAPAYAAFIVGAFGGRRQVVGYDKISLGGWDVKTGQRLWQLVPPVEGDFNVPTPVAVEGGLIVTTENNGTRWYRFDAAGKIIAAPAGTFAALATETITPVVVDGKLFGAGRGLHCLSLRDGLKPLWQRMENLGDHASFFADAERVLVVSNGGELLLLDARSESATVLARARLFEGDVETYAHPALAGTRLYARGAASVVCVDLAVN